MSEKHNRTSPGSRGGPGAWRIALRAGRRSARVAAAAIGIGLAGWAYGALVIWGFIAILRGVLGRPGLAAGSLVAHVVGAGPRGAVTGFAATMGVPVHWRVPLLHVGGWAAPASLVAGKPWLVAVSAVPLLSGALMGWLAGAAAARSDIGARALLAASAAAFALIGAAAVLAAGLGSSGSFLTLAASPGWTLLLGAVWAAVGGGAGMAARTALARRERLPGMVVNGRVARAAGAAAATLLLLGSPVLAAGAAEASACAGNPNSCTAGNDGFIAAVSDGAAGLSSSGPSGSVVLNSGYHFQDYLNYVQEFWMTHETNVYWN